MRVPACRWLLAIALAVAGCGGEEAVAPAPEPPVVDPDRPPAARWDLVETLRQDRTAVRHPSDGGGRAWLEGEARATAQVPGRWVVIYEAGEQGVDVGGMVFLMTSPFWGWSTPQSRDPGRHGYTEVTTEAEGVTLRAETADAQLLAVSVQGRRLAPGERIRFVFGASEALAGPDRFAEGEERIWVAVDGDGDGVRAVLPDSPRLDIAPGPPAQLHAAWPSTARPGEEVRLVASVLDAAGNAGGGWQGTLEVDALPEGLEGPTRLPLAGSDAGSTRATYRALRPGVYRLRLRAGEWKATTNPLVVGPGPRVLWADLHGHSNLSDGTGTPEDFYGYARDVAGLDVAALTDHDHWGVRFLDERPDLWERIRAAVRAHHEPGRFVALLGYEWTSWIHGHRHVLYFEDDGPLLSSLDEAYDDPRELWAALDGRPALTFAHHSAGGPIPTNWAIPPDPHFEPVTEVASVHGSSEALDAPGVIYSPWPGNFVRDALGMGYRLGFVGSGDGHDGHPGLAHLASLHGGLAGIVAEEATREGVLAALRARRVYATNGPRILLRTRLAGRPMGSAVPASELADDPELLLQVVAPGEIHTLELVRGPEVVRTFEGGGATELSLAVPVGGLDLAPGDFLYVRVTLIGSGAAWSSPFFVE